MFAKKYLLLILLLSVTSYAHIVAGFDMSLVKLTNNQIQVKAFRKKSKTFLIGNKVRLISMIDNRILVEGKLTAKGLILNIPQESYWVYILIRDTDIVKDGLAPDEGFKTVAKKDKLAFIYSLIISLIFCCMSIFIGIKRYKGFKQSLEVS